MARKIVKCDCGFVVRASDDDTLVRELQQHAREHHRIELTHEQARDAARPVEPATGGDG